MSKENVRKIIINNGKGRIIFYLPTQLTKGGYILNLTGK